MQHFLNRPSMMSSLNHLQRNTFINPHRSVFINIAELELTLELVNTQVIHLLKLLVDLFLHFLVFQKGNQGVTILPRVLLLALLLFLVLYKRYK